MSAVIWCGIVAVWVFVLIPTWVRRGDIHWHRGAAVVTQGADASNSRSRRRLPAMHLRRRAHAEKSVEVKAMAEQDAVMREEFPTPERVSAAAPQGRVAAASRSGRLGGAVRASLGQDPKRPARKKPTLRIRRARRLVSLAAIALVTLLVAVLSGGLFIVVNVVADLALLCYVRHLRNAARQRAAKAAREKRARVARQAWEQASAQERASQLDGWQTPAAPLPETQPYDAVEFVDAAEYDDPEEATRQIDLTALEQPALLDLTDAPTEELIAAQAS